MARNIEWNPAEGGPPPGAVFEPAGDEGSTYTLQPPQKWKTRDLVIASILFALTAPLLIVSLGALAANVMALAAMSDPVANQGSTASGVLGMLGLIAVTTAYPFVYALSLIVTIVRKRLSWVSYLVIVAALPMLAIVAWLFGYSNAFFNSL